LPQAPAYGNTWSHFNNNPNVTGSNLPCVLAGFQSPGFKITPQALLGAPRDFARIVWKNKQKKSILSREPLGGAVPAQVHHIPSPGTPAEQKQKTLYSTAGANTSFF
jgi:hypothetical protein